MQLLKTLKDQKMSLEHLQNKLGLKDRKSFRARYLLPALSQHLIKMTLPGKPNSSLQKYCLTALGKQLALDNKPGNQ